MWLCAQRRLRSAWASAQSDQSLRCPHEEGSLATHWADSKYSDQTGWMPRLIWFFAGRKLVLFVLSCCGSCDFYLSQDTCYTQILPYTPSSPLPDLGKCCRPESDVAVTECRVWSGQMSQSRSAAVEHGVWSGYTTTLLALNTELKKKQWIKSDQSSLKWRMDSSTMQYEESTGVEDHVTFSRRRHQTHPPLRGRWLGQAGREPKI